MGSFFRSEEMSFCQLFIQPEAIYSSVAELGEIGVVQFKDLNEKLVSHQRNYVAEVRRIGEMERRLEIIQRELQKDEIEIFETAEDHSYPNPREITDLETLVEKNQTEVEELSENYAQLLENQSGFIEYQHVLERAENFFNETSPSLSIDGSEENYQLNYVVGLIDLDKSYGLERMLWRVTLGNIYFKNSMIDEPFKDVRTGKDVFKTVFIAYFQGEALKKKVKNICDGYKAKTVPFSNKLEERLEIMTGLKTRIADIEIVINQTRDHRQRVLNHAARSFNKWSIQLKKLKAIYHTMNLFSIDVSQKCLIGECWVPSSDILKVQKALQKGSKASSSTVPSIVNIVRTTEMPPTFNRTNKFTQGFQNLIDSYGVASYREVNPAFYTVVTFPFLFSVMYGDIGHGILLSLIGLWMVTSEKKLEKIKEEIFNLFFSGRYVILLMGIYSIYSGFLYNDIFSKSLNMFGSSWTVNYDSNTIMAYDKIQLNPSSNDLMTDRTYPLGLDPVWQVAENKILFTNSFKMKLSIIFGVTHMIFGLSLTVINSINFRKRSSIILEFVPQLIFLLSLFGYMVFMMFYKWVRFSPKADQPYSPGCAPSVLVYFIKMMLFGENEALPGCKPFMFPGQGTVQLVLVIVAALCIPCILLGKPIYTLVSRRNRSLISTSTGDIEEESMADVWTNQGIHTIEYILGTVSHTASYLRLWALSLAHAQLSDVLWNKVYMAVANISIPYLGSFAVFNAFAIWAFLTVAILIVIEGLSAFLHTLRLHWVEFMDKFYDGNGYKFEPFSFKAIINGEN